MTAVLSKIFHRYLLVVVPFFPIHLSAQTIYPGFEDGVVYARCTAGTAFTLPYDSSNMELNACMAQFGITEMLAPFPGMGSPLDRVYRFRFDDIDQVDSLIACMQGMAFMEYAEYSPFYALDFTPNDFSPNFAPYLQQVHALQAWDISTGSPNITIAIIDNGVRLTHEDLKDKLWTNPGEIPGNGLDDDLNGYVDDVHGYDMADRDGNPSPPATNIPYWDHGTHCAGIAAAESNNGLGEPSIGFNTSIMALKCAPSADSGNSLANVYEALLYAINNGADVISMSFGSPEAGLFTSESLIEAGRNMGAIMVAAAGNNGNEAPSYPAAYDEVISVGAVAGNDTRASYSNYGETIDIMAPGSNIFSAAASADNAYVNLFGTSMACPMVAATMALLLDEFPNESFASLRTRLLEGADPIDHLNPGETGLLGAGRLNVYAALTGSQPSFVENRTETNFRLFPNPAEGNLWLQCHNNVQLSLVNSCGHTIASYQFPKGSHTIELPRAPAGLYMAKFTETTSGKVNVQKVVLK